MTLETDQGTITAKFSGATWSGIWSAVAVVIVSAVGLYVKIEGRVITLESSDASQNQRVGAAETRIDETRREFVGELRALRLELKK